jgi:hypothetical protein
LIDRNYKPLSQKVKLKVRGSALSALGFFVM